MPATPPPAVRCPHCAARLRVTDRSLIGTTSSCPRCGGDVLIQLPEAATAASATPRDAPPATANVVAPPVVATNAPPTAAPPINTPPANTPPAAVPGGGVTGRGLPGTHPTGHDDSPAPLPLDPSAVWQSESSRRARQLVLIAALAGFGLIAAAVGFAMFARSFSSSGPDAVASGSQANPAEENPVGPTDPAAGDAADQTAADHTAIGGDDSDQGQSSTLPPPDGGGADPVAPAATEEPADGDLAAGQPAADQPADGEPAGDGAAASDRADVQTGDTAGQAAGDAGDAGDAGELFSSIGSLDDLPPELRRFVPLLDLAAADESPTDSSAPPTIDTIRLDSAARWDTAAPAESRRATVDIAKALTLRVAIEQQGMPLPELALLVSQITAIPVELELISLDLAGVSLDQPLTTPSGWTPVGQWLDQTLAPLGLATETRDGCLVIHASPAKLLEAGDAALRLDDFGDQAASLASWLQPLVSPPLVATSDDADPAAGDNADSPDAPTNPAGNLAANSAVSSAAEPVWQWDAANGQLRVQEHRSVIIQTLCVVEALRLQRNLPPRIPRQQTRRWLGRWDDDDRSPQSIGDWPPVRDGQVNQPIDSPKTIAGLLRESGWLNQTSVVVVWPDAIRQQLYPIDLAMPSSDGVGLGDYFDDLLGDTDLQVRDAGGATWWVGSDGLYDRYEVITWLNLPPPQNDQDADGGQSGTISAGERVARQLAQALGGVAVDSLPVAWDDQVILMRAPRYIARQLHRLAAEP